MKINAWLDGTKQDLRFSVRSLSRAPGFTALAVALLAIGIGATSLIFSFVDLTLLRGLPYPNVEELVEVLRVHPRGHPVLVTPATFAHWKENVSGMEGAIAERRWHANLTGVEDPEPLIGRRVTEGFFELFGVRVVAGRTFLADDYAPGSARVVVLSHHFWHRRFGGALGSIGQVLSLDGQAHTIVGVMGDRHAPPQKDVTDFWTPLPTTTAFLEDGLDDFGLNPSLHVFARVQPASRSRLERALKASAHALQSSTGSERADWDVTVRSMLESHVAGWGETVRVLFGAVAFTLLITCVSVATMLLARGASRQQELAVRGALGAGRRPVVRQLMVESLLLAVAGAACGVVVAYASVGPVVSVAPQMIQAVRLEGMTVDTRVLAFAAVLSGAAAVISGTVPALQASRISLLDALGNSLPAGSRTTGRLRTQNLLVVAQVAMSFVLLIGALLMLRSVRKLQATDPGFSADRVLTMRVPLAPYKYQEESRQARVYERMLERVSALPGVWGAALSNPLPQGRFELVTTFHVEGEPVDPDQVKRRTHLRLVSPKYFEALGIPVVQGRRFTARDDERGPRVAIVNQEFAERHFPGVEPLGKHISRSFPPEWITVVGVAADIRHQTQAMEPEPELYLPYSQSLIGSFGTALIVRTASDPMSLAGAIRGEVHSIDPDAPVVEVRLMDHVVAGTYATKRFYSLLIGAFAAVALILAAAGIFGLLSHAVNRRTREIGVRMALGADRAHLRRLVIGRALGLVVVGLAVGVAGALALTRLLESQLYEVAPTDLLSFVVAAALFFVAALAAACVPARRATRVEPVEALRQE